jgi:hypothetical protein
VARRKLAHLSVGDGNFNFGIFHEGPPFNCKGLALDFLHTRIWCGKVYSAYSAKLLVTLQPLTVFPGIALKRAWARAVLQLVSIGHATGIGEPL